jgi:hypothetical protein
MPFLSSFRDFFFEEPHFKDTWDQFEHVKDAMMRETGDVMKQFDTDFRYRRHLV